MSGKSAPKERRVTLVEAAARFRVGVASIGRAGRVMKRGIHELVRAVERGDMELKRADAISRGYCGISNKKGRSQ